MIRRPSRWMSVVTLALVMVAASLPGVAQAVSPAVVHAVSDADSHIFGSADPGSWVIVWSGETIIGYGECAGHFTVPIPKQKAGTILKVTVESLQSDVPQTFHLKVRDKTAPAPPKVDRVGDNHTAVTGTAEPGATITVQVDNKPIGTGTVDATGRFSVPVEPIRLGTWVQVIAKDAAGNSNQWVTVSEDTTPPPAPAVDPFNAEMTRVTGRTGPGVRVTVKAQGLESAAGLSDDQGRFALTIPRQAEGNLLRVVADDYRGNFSPVSEVTVTAPGTLLYKTDTGSRMVRLGSDGTASVAFVVTDLPSGPQSLLFDLSQREVTVGSRTGAVSEVSVTLPVTVLRRAAAEGQELKLLAPGAGVAMGPGSFQLPAGLTDGAAIRISITNGRLSSAETEELGSLGVEPRGLLLRTAFELVQSDQVQSLAKLGQPALIRLGVANARDLTLTGLYHRIPGRDQWERLTDLGMVGSSTAEVSVASSGQFVIGEYTRPFADLPKAHLAERAVMWMAARGLVRGREGNRFDPEAPITRAEFAALLVRALGHRGTNGEAPAFGDVPADAWYARDVVAVARAGLMKGAGDHFRPGDLVSREEMAVVLARSLEAAGIPTAVTDMKRQQWAGFYGDSQTVSPWAWDAVISLGEQEIMPGRGLVFVPHSAATRAEVVTALRRVLAALAD